MFAQLSRPKSWSPDEGRRPYTKPEKLPGPLTPTERSPGVEGMNMLCTSSQVLEKLMYDL